MKIQPVMQNNNVIPSSRGYKDLSKQILNSERADLIDLAERFHTASEKELKEITKTSNKAYDTLKSVIDMVNIRKRCYIADGSSFCAQRAKELDSKAETRTMYLA